LSGFFNSLLGLTHRRFLPAGKARLSKAALANFFVKMLDSNGWNLLPASLLRFFHPDVTSGL
jgi:hypothetical protein